MSSYEKLTPPGILARDITKNLEYAPEQFSSILEDLEVITIVYFS